MDLSIFHQIVGEEPRIPKPAMAETIKNSTITE